MVINSPCLLSIPLCFCTGTDLYKKAALISQKWACLLQTELGDMDLYFSHLLIDQAKCLPINFWLNKSWGKFMALLIYVSKDST